MGLNIKDLFKKKETIQEEPPLPAYPDSEEEKPALDFSKMKRSDEELGIAMDGWSDFLSESPISEDILLEIQQPTPEDFEQGTEEEADTPEITLSEKFISDLETIHEKPEEFVPSTNFSEFRPLTALNCDEEEIDPLAAFLRWSEKNPQKNVRPGKKNFQPVENREEKAVIPGDDSPDVIDGKLNALLFIDDYANMGSVVGKSTDNNSPVNDKSANTDEFSENVSDSEPLLSEEIFSTSPVAESETQPETFPTIIADNSEAENRGASSDDPHDVADEREAEIDLPVSSSKPETYSVDEDVPMSLDDVFKALSSGGPLSDGEFSADDSMVITSEMMASVYNETETASPQTNLSATETEAVQPQTNFSATETEAASHQINFSATETEAALPQTNLSATETETALPQTNLSATETEAVPSQTNLSATETETVPSQTNFSVPETEAALPQTNLSATETEAASHQINFSAKETEAVQPQTNLSATETEKFSMENNAAAALKFFKEKEMLEGFSENSLHLTLDECGKIENLLNYLNYLMEFAPPEAQNDFYKSGYLTKITCLSKILRYKCGVWTSGEYRNELQRLLEGLRENLDGENFETLAHYLELMVRNFKDKADRAEFLGKIQAIRRHKTEKC